MSKHNGPDPISESNARQSKFYQEHDRTVPAGPEDTQEMEPVSETIEPGKSTPEDLIQQYREAVLAYEGYKIYESRKAMEKAHDALLSALKGAK